VPSRKTKNGEDEKLDSASLDKVIALLEAEKPITKKDACGLLNIAYNTTRLASLIEKHKEKKARDKQRRQEKRGKPATSDEINYIISGYLEGETIDSLSSSIHRPGTFVKQVLDRHEVPIRSRSHDYFRPELIPEGAMRTKFDMGEKVYSARYDSMAVIEGEFPHSAEYVYRLWLLGEKWMCYAYQPASELASLEHLKEIGVKI
jgi:hypothetical protein